VKRAALGLVAVAIAAGAASADTAPGPDAGKQAFVAVARVLQSPRCVNCHPAGDAPLQGDRARKHAMNITRASVEAGVACNTCHQEKNSEAIGIPGGPPGAPKWDLPPRETPMVFQNRSLRALCEQLKDPEQNGHKQMAALIEHVEHDPLVLWGWQPGGKRTVPPLDHARFVAAFKTWAAAGAVCP
jgi:hypothetical protein